MDAFDEHEVDPLMSSHGIPAAIQDKREPYQRTLVMCLILASTAFERIAFYTVLTMLATTLQLPELFAWDDRHSKTALYIFSGVSYISTLIFAALTDWKLGRAKTIIIGFALYLLGLISITITTSGSTFLCHFDEKNHRNATVIGEEKCAPALLGTLIFTAIGAGAVKSNLAVFGAEQIQKSKITSRYFDNYAMATSFGIIIATVIVPYTENVLEHHYYYIPYLVASLILLLAVILFLIGWRFYLHVQSNETVIRKCIPVLINALQSRYKFKKIKRAMNKDITNSSTMNSVYISHSDTVIRASMGIHGRPSTLLDYAKAMNGGKFFDRIVDDVKSLRSALLVFTLLIPFWLVYNQTSTTFPAQGAQMSGSNLKYIVPWVSLGDPITVIIGILIFKIFLYKYIDTRHKAVTIATKFVIGMCFAFLSMIAAGTVELFRQHKCKEGSNLSIYLQLAQNIFIGFSQLFGMVGSYEYAYFAAPRSAQSLFMSLHFCSIGIASFIGAIYINYFPNSYVDINFACQKNNQWSWSFYTYFFILAGFQLIFIIIFILCQKKYRMVKLNPQQIETNQFLQHLSTSSAN